MDCEIQIFPFQVVRRKFYGVLPEIPHPQTSGSQALKPSDRAHSFSSEQTAQSAQDALHGSEPPVSNTPVNQSVHEQYGASHSQVRKLSIMCFTYSYEKTNYRNLAIFHVHFLL